MPISGKDVQPFIWKRSLELYIACKQHARRPHCRIQNVIADARDGSPTDEVALANLRSIAPDFLVERAFRFQSHLGPDLDDRSVQSILALDILDICSRIVEEIEPDQFDPL